MTLIRRTYHRTPLSIGSRVAKCVYFSGGYKVRGVEIVAVIHFVCRNKFRRRPDCRSSRIVCRRVRIDWRRLWINFHLRKSGIVRWIQVKVRNDWMTIFSRTRCQPNWRRWIGESFCFHFFCHCLSMNDVEQCNKCATRLHTTNSKVKLIDSVGR